MALESGIVISSPTNIIFNFVFLILNLNKITNIVLAHLCHSDD